MRPSPDLTLPDERDRPVSKRKNTSRWCKGKEGIRHQVSTVIDHRAAMVPWYQSPTGKPCFLIERPTYSRWVCCHHSICTVCGKIVNHFPSCPERPEGLVTTWD